MAAKIIVFVFLLYLSVVDMKKRSICLLVPVTGSVFAMGLHLCFDGKFLGFFFTALFFLLFFLGVARWTKGQLGEGDAFAFGMTGAAVGFLENLFLMYLSFVFAFAAAIVCLFRKKGRTYRMPFLPFLCLAYLCVVFEKYMPF